MGIHKDQTEKTKAKLIQSVSELIAERGIRAFSITDIAARAKTTRSLATHHFKLKDAVVAAAVADLLPQTAPSFPPPNGNARSFVAAIARALAGFKPATPRNRAVHAVLTDVSIDRPREAQVRHYLAAHGVLVQWLRSIRQPSPIRPGVDVEQQAFAILAMIRGSQTMALLEIPGFEAKAFAEEVANSILWALDGGPHSRFSLGEASAAEPLEKR